MRSAAVNAGDNILATQYDNLRLDAQPASYLYPHQQSSPGLTLYIEAGNYFLGGTKVIYAGGNSPSFTVPSTNPRIDLLVIDSSGTLTIVQGTENASPVAPTYPKDKIVLCEVYNRVSETSIKDSDDSANGYIYNHVRPFLNNGKYISQSGAEIFVASDTGSANAYAIALNPAITAYTDGLLIAFRAANANTGASTLAVNGLAAKSIKKAYNVALAANDILANQIVLLQYDSTQGVFQMQSMVGNLPTSFLSSSADGNATLDGTATVAWASLSGSTYTMSRNAYLGNLTINSGITLVPNGYMIFWTNTFTVNGTIAYNGNSGSNGNNGPGGTTPGSGGGGAGAVGGNTINGGSAGGSGASGGGGNVQAGGGTGGSSSGGSSVTNSLCTNNGATGGSGGGGGSPSNGGGGGAGGGGSVSAASQGPYQIPQLMVFCSISKGVFTAYQGAPGSSGGGGGGGGGSTGGGTNQSGGGGGGGGAGSSGGIILMIGNILSVGATGMIQANGGTGGNGGNGGGPSGVWSNASGGGGGGGGGAGGNGGLIVLAYVSLINSGTIQANGGAGGTGGSGAGGMAGGGTGSAGGAGSTGGAGTILQIVI